MPNIEYGKSITIINMQVVITKIWFTPRRICKIRCDMLIRTSVWKSIQRASRGDIIKSKIGIRLLFMTYKFRVLWHKVTKGIVKLAPGILPK